MNFILYTPYLHFNKLKEKEREREREQEIREIYKEIDRELNISEGKRGSKAKKIICDTFIFYGV